MGFPHSILQQDEQTAFFQVKDTSKGGITKGYFPNPCADKCFDIEKNGGSPQQCYMNCLKNNETLRTSLETGWWYPTHMILCRDVEFNYTFEQSSEKEDSSSTSVNVEASASYGPFSVDTSTGHNSSSSNKVKEGGGNSVYMKATTPVLCGYIANPIPEWPKRNFVDPGDMSKKWEKALQEYVQSAKENKQRQEEEEKKQMEKEKKEKEQTGKGKWSSRAPKDEH